MVAPDGDPTPLFTAWPSTSGWRRGSGAFDGTVRLAAASRLDIGFRAGVGGARTVLGDAPLWGELGAEADAEASGFLRGDCPGDKRPGRPGLRSMGRCERLESGAREVVRDDGRGWVAA
jgi:hypothetical protein